MNEQSDENATWYQATQVAVPRRNRLTYELDVDVCIVGAGLAGLTAAREIARRGWSVVVLEGGQVGGAASGRNSGFVLPGFSEDIDDIIERIGLDHATRLWGLSERGVDYVRKTIAQENMPGVDPVAGWLHVSKTDSGRRLQANIERLRWLGTAVEFWPVERVRDVLPSEQYFSAAHFPGAFHIHPLNYTIGLAAAAEAAGARILEDTPAISIDPAGIRKRIQTPSAMIRAGHVILSGNVHLGSLMPRLAATLIPITTYILVTEPLGAALHEVIRYRGAISDGERADHHYRIVGGDRLQWSGRMTTSEVDPLRFVRSLVAGLGGVFPSLAGVKVANIWSGTFGRPLHRMPQIGEIQRGVWVASGFSGHGINNTAMAGELIARGLVDNDETWRLFAPYELVWAGGKAGRIIAKALYTGSRPVQAVREGLARYVARARKRRAAAKSKNPAPAADRDGSDAGAPAA